MDNEFMENRKIKIAAVVGPTASGKSALATELAIRYGGEIVSCDSMQVYRGLDIGTAKSTKAEMRGIPHRMTDVADPREDFSCADYAEMAEKAVKDILSRGKLPIFCGGTGLYLDSFLRGARDDGAIRDEAVRAELAEYAVRNGAEALHEKLREVDPDAADAIHPNNVKRVIRALEVFRVSGKTKTELDRLSREKECEYNPLIICLKAENRELLYGRIDRRAEEMMKKGLENEVRDLYARGMLPENSTAAQAIGYKEMIACIKGEITAEEALDEIKLASRRYAKRQETWFGRRENVDFIAIDDGHQTKTFEEIVNNAVKLFNSFGFCDILNKM